MEPMDVDD
jgi:hypothetical protein